MVEKAQELLGRKTIPDAEMEAIVTAHESALLRYAAGILNDAHAAQDVVQTSFIKLFRLWKPGSKPSDSIRAWLFRVTHNEAVDHLRREGRIRLLHRRHAEESRPAENRAVPEEEKLERVLSSVAQLPPAERQVLLLRLQEGLSYRDISAVTGKTEGHVGLLLHNAVRKVGELVRKSEGVIP